MDPKASVLPTTPQRPTYNHAYCYNRAVTLAMLQTVVINYTGMYFVASVSINLCYTDVMRVSCRLVGASYPPTSRPETHYIVCYKNTLIRIKMF